MLSTIKKQLIKDFEQKIKAEGLRGFTSENGEYGFFTDLKGTRVVSFQLDYLTGEYLFFGYYRAVNPAHTRSVGTVWVIDNSLTFKEMLVVDAPAWTTRGYSVSYLTLEEYLKIYKKSSKFSELV